MMMMTINYEDTQKYMTLFDVLWNSNGDVKVTTGGAELSQSGNQARVKYMWAIGKLS